MQLWAILKYDAAMSTGHTHTWMQTDCFELDWEFNQALKMDLDLIFKSSGLRYTVYLTSLKEDRQCILYKDFLESISMLL